MDLGAVLEALTPPAAIAQDERDEQALDEDEDREREDRDEDQVSWMPSAFGDAGSTGVKPPFAASAAGATRRSGDRQQTTRGQGASRLGTRCHSMNVPERAPRGTRVRLPADVTRPFEVYVNGVPQEEGRDFRVEGRTLVFERELKRRASSASGAGSSIFVGVAGTYRQNDSVDVVYERNGKRVVATKLPLEPLELLEGPTGSVGRWRSRQTGSRSRGSFASTRRARARSTGSTSTSRPARSTASSGRTAPASRRPSTS